MRARTRGKRMAVALTVAILTGCATEAQYVDTTIEEARDHAGRRNYDRSHEILDAALARVADDVELTLEKASIYMRAHEYGEAGEWYLRAAQLDSLSWKAIVGRWKAEFQGHGKSEQAKGRVLAAADAFLSEAPDSLTNLSAAVAAYGAVGEEEASQPLKDRLASLYPESELGSEIIKEEIDWIGVERDDETRLAMAEEFLEKHPVTRWRPRVMRLKLVSLRRLGRHEDVEAAALEWLPEHGDDPEALDIIASALVASKRVPDQAVEAAARAAELVFAECESLGVVIDDRGGRKLLRPIGPASVEEERLEELKTEISTHHLTLARALLEAGNHAEAGAAATTSLSYLDIDADDEETGAAHHYVLGRALEGTAQYDVAFDAYLRSLLVGGRQNRWAARADTALSELYAKSFPSESASVSLVEFCRERTGYEGPIFTDVTEEAGLSGRSESRVAWGDYDGDGYDDLLLSGQTLFRNWGDGTFEDVTERAAIGGSGANGGVWADVDNDGDLDFYATSGATEGERTDALWLNRGNGVFEDWTDRAGGMTDLYTTEGAAWGDADSDGLVDLYLASYERPSGGDWTKLGQGFPDILYRNLGDGVFEDASEAFGIEPPFGEHLSGRGVNWGDFDNDGDLDIFVSNYRLQENFLWRNDGDVFTNVAPELGVSGRETDGWWGHTIGSEWGDFDNDGDLDLMSANLAHPRYIEVSDMSMLLVNEGAPEWGFEDRRSFAGIKYAETHSDPSWGDLDSDGDLDLFITSIYPDCGTFLYLNDGRGRFWDATWLAGVRSFNGWGSAMCDYDRDGDLDIAVGSGSGFRLFRNDGLARQGHPSHWIEVRAVGTRSNAAGIGARVRVTNSRGTQMREIQGGKGTTSQHSISAFFGLGTNDEPVTVEVRFLGGETVVRESVAVDQRIVILEGGERE